MLRKRTEDRITMKEQGSFIQKRCRVGMGVLKAAVLKFHLNAHGFVCYLIGQNLCTSCGENLH